MFSQTFEFSPTVDSIEGLVSRIEKDRGISEWSALTFPHVPPPHHTREFRVKVALADELGVVGLTTDELSGEKGVSLLKKINCAPLTPYQAVYFCVTTTNTWPIIWCVHKPIVVPHEWMRHPNNRFVFGTKWDSGKSSVTVIQVREEERMIPEDVFAVLEFSA